MEAKTSLLPSSASSPCEACQAFAISVNKRNSEYPSSSTRFLLFFTTRVTRLAHLQLPATPFQPHCYKTFIHRSLPIPLISDTNNSHHTSKCQTHMPLCQRSASCSRPSSRGPRASQRSRPPTSNTATSRRSSTAITNASQTTSNNVSR